MRAYLLLSFLVAHYASAQTSALLHTNVTDLAASVRQLEEIRATGARVSVIIGPGWYVVHGSGGEMDALRATHGMEVFHRGEAVNVTRDASREERVAMAWLGNHSPIEPVDLLRPAHAPCHGHTPAEAFDRAEYVPPLNYYCGRNSEILSGTVFVSNMVMESNGAIGPDSLDWTDTYPDMEAVYAQIVRVQDFLANAAAVYSAPLTFVNAFYLCEVGYEPALDTLPPATYWMREATMIMTGDTELDTSAVQPRLDEWNSRMRTIHGTDHATSGFVARGVTFQSGLGGRAVIGGPSFYTMLGFMYAHELSHTFHAIDEHAYGGVCEDQFNGVFNSNDNLCDSTQEVCVMAGAGEIQVDGEDTAWVYCPYSAGHLGWTSTLEPSEQIAPAANSTFYDPLVEFTWNDPHASEFEFVRLVKLNDVGTSEDDEIICGTPNDPEILLLSLLNGKYRWSVGARSSGYAEVMSESRIFLVDAPLHADFTQDVPAICANDTVRFTDMSTGAPNSWEWTFTGGAPATYSGQYPPPVIYDTPGNYTVSLVVGDGAGEDEEEQLFAVTVYGIETLPYQQTFNDVPGCGWGLFSDQNDPVYGTNWQPTDLGGCGEGLVADGFTWNATAHFTLVSPLLDVEESTHPVMRIRYSYRSDGSTTESMAVGVYTCGGTEPLAGDILQGLPIDAIHEPSAPWTPNGGCDQWNTLLVDLTNATGSLAQVKLTWECSGGQAFYIDQVDVFEAIRVKAKVFLDGPYDPGPHTMKDDLRTLLSPSDPYDAGPFALTGNWTHAWHNMHINPVLLNTTDNNNALVDWVVLELRDASNASTLLAARPCLVQRDGDLVDIDGQEGVWFDVPATNYYVSVRHRNHLGTRTATAVAISNSMSAVDFTLTSTSTFGTNARNTAADGKATLWCGDARSDRNVKYTGSANDPAVILIAVGSTTPNNTLNSVYRNEDVNMNGQVKYSGAGNDRDPILVTLGGNPNRVRNELVE